MNNFFHYLFKFINIKNEFYFHRVKFKLFIKYLIGNFGNLLYQSIIFILQIKYNII